MTTKPFVAFQSIPEGLEATQDMIGNLIRDGMKQIADQAEARGYTVLWDTMRFEPQVDWIDTSSFVETHRESFTSLRLEATSVKTSTIEELLALDVDPAALLDRLRKVVEGKRCTCDGGSFHTPAENAARHPFIVNPDCPIHGEG